MSTAVRRSSSKLKAASSGASKRSARSAQGAQLPADRSVLESYPVGCCVQIEVAGALSWYLIACRIGGQGAPHCARMRVPPSSAGWNAGLEDARETSAGVVVLGSCWPYRPSSSDAESGEASDPFAADLSGSTARTGDGVMMFGHMRGSGGAQ